MIPRNEVVRSLLSLEMQPLRMKLGAIDLDKQRRMFRELGGRSSSAVLSAGCDQDDTIVERYILCGLDHERVHAIACVDGLGRAPYPPDGIATGPLRIARLNVVVNKRKVVDEFHSRRCG